MLPFHPKGDFYTFYTIYKTYQTETSQTAKVGLKHTSIFTSHLSKVSFSNISKFHEHHLQRNSNRPKDKTSQNSTHLYYQLIYVEESMSNLLNMSDI